MPTKNREGSALSTYSSSNIQKACLNPIVVPYQYLKRMSVAAERWLIAKLQRARSEGFGVAADLTAGSESIARSLVLDVG